MGRIYGATIVVIGGVMALGISAFVHWPTPPAAEVAPAWGQALSGINDAQAYLLPLAESNIFPARKAGSADAITGARAAYVFDVATLRPLFAKNEDMRVPIASLTKIMSAVVVLERLHAQDVVTVTAESIRVDGTKRDLSAGDRFTVGDLMRFMLVQSSNDAAAALSVYARERGIDFIKEMNDTAARIGMTHTIFKDPAGLDDTAHATARDLGFLIRYALRYEHQIFEPLREKTFVLETVDETRAITVTNTNQLLDTLEGIRGGKTGYTDGARGCMILLVQVPETRDTIAAVVLGSEDRFTHTAELVTWARTAFQWQ
ncbi:MAG: serine hydrolase [Patescibacteria group bacterium]